MPDRVDASPFQPVVETFRRRRGIRVKEITDAVRSLKGRRRPDLHDPHLRWSVAGFEAPLRALSLTAILQEIAAFDPAFVARPRLRILDLDGGPGAGLLAALQFWRGGGTALEYAGVDRVRECHDDAQLIHEIFSEIADDLPPTSTDFYRVAPEGKYDLVFSRDPAEHSVEPDGYLVLLRSAAREETVSLMKARDRLIEGGWRASAPCLPDGPCPMLRTDDWCTMEIPLNRPRFIQEVDLRLGARKRTLRYSYLVVTRDGRGLRDLSPDAVRLVGDIRRDKGRASGLFCAGSGELKRCQLLTRHLDDGNRAFVRAVRGDVLDLKTGPKGSGTAVRLKTFDNPRGGA